MLLSELIEELKTILEQEGEMPVYLSFEGKEFEITKQKIRKVLENEDDPQRMVF